MFETRDWYYVSFHQQQPKSEAEAEAEVEVEGYRKYRTCAAAVPTGTGTGTTVRPKIRTVQWLFRWWNSTLIIYCIYVEVWRCIPPKIKTETSIMCHVMSPTDRPIITAEAEKPHFHLITTTASENARFGDVSWLFHKRDFDSLWWWCCRFCSVRFGCGFFVI